MKHRILQFLAILVIFLFTAVSTMFIFGISQGAFSKTIGSNKGISMLLIYLVLFLITWLSLKAFKQRIGFSGVIITLSVVLLLLIILNLDGATIRFTYKVLPFYISWVLGVLSGFLWYIRTKNRIIVAMVLAIFPAIMAVGVYNLWFHRVEYGNWTGNIPAEMVGDFEFTDKDDELITNTSLKGKLVLFDFWFINCGPCWKKFPELQRLYDTYKSNPNIVLYAVNRPMKSDKPGALFTSIEERGYSFPVLKGSQEVLDRLGVYKYPTVMILNTEGELIFMGEIEDAEKTLEKLLQSI